MLEQTSVRDGPKYKHLMEQTLQYEDDRERRVKGTHYLGPAEYAQVMAGDRRKAEEASQKKAL